MNRLLLLLVALLSLLGAVVAAPKDPSGSSELLFIHDSAKAAEPLLDFLKTKGGFHVTVVEPANLPPDLSGYRAVLGYIHKGLQEPVELAIIDYTERGGRFIAIHHMISSGKAANAHYFKFLGIQLDAPKESSKPVEPGQGYGWYTGPRSAEGEEAGITYDLVKLHPSHFIVNNEIAWGPPVPYQSADTPAAEYPAITLPRAEAYMNHKFTDGSAKTVLCGMKYTDPRNGAIFQQDRMAWVKDYGAGKIFYFQPGHFLQEFRIPNIRQMILNAIIWDGNPSER